MRFLIEKGDFGAINCLEFDCETKILLAELERLFREKDNEVLDKFKKFRQKRLDNCDPLVRYCARVGCSGRMRANSMKASKLTCPDCSMQICFRCRDEYHGYFVSCEQNMENKLEGWAAQNGKISFCPMCRTKI